MRHTMMSVLAFFVLTGTALGQETQGERNIREQAEQAALAAAAGQLFVEQFTTAPVCEAGQEEVVNDSRLTSRRSSTYVDNPRRQNRRRVQSLRFRGQRPFAEGPSLRFFSRSDGRSIIVCESKR